MRIQQAVRPKPLLHRGVDRAVERTHVPVESHYEIERVPTVGNQAAARLGTGRGEGGQTARRLQSSGPAPHEVAASAALPRSMRASFLLQRKCACSGGATECEECGRRKADRLQTKL